jgi:hypothetical protein
VAEQPQVEDPQRERVLAAPGELGARRVEGGRRSTAEQVRRGGQLGWREVLDALPSGMPVSGALTVDALDEVIAGDQIRDDRGGAGADLGPVIDALNWWALQHAWRWPQPGEPLHAEHLLRAAIQAIDHATNDHQPARWHFRLDGGDYLAESDGHHWSLTARTPTAPADVTITATTQALAAFIFAQPDPGIDITGETGPVQRFRHLISTLATVAHPG